MNSLAQDVVNLLGSRNLTLGAIESATGGLISHLITNIPGSSDVFQGSVTSYSNRAKTAIVGVSEESINRYGAVSPQVAEEMAEGGRRLLNVDVCVADTGITGPGGATEDKPVGLFYIGLSHKGGTFSRKHIFSGTREENKQSAAETALQWVREYLESVK